MVSSVSASSVRSQWPVCDIAKTMLAVLLALHACDGACRQGMRKLGTFQYVKDEFR